MLLLLNWEEFGSLLLLLLPLLSMAKVEFDLIAGGMTVAVEIRQTQRLLKTIVVAVSRGDGDADGWVGGYSIPNGL